VTPTYFEAHVGLTPDEPGPEVISDDPVRVPGTDVELRGKIDRVDITPDGGLVGMDYKTGSTNSESDTIDGHAFQLPAYLLMAEDALDGEPVGASYYQVTPTSSVSPHDGTIGGDEDAAHAYWGRMTRTRCDATDRSRSTRAPSSTSSSTTPFRTGSAGLRPPSTTGRSTQLSWTPTPPGASTARTVTRAMFATTADTPFTSTSPTRTPALRPRPRHGEHQMTDDTHTDDPRDAGDEITLTRAQQRAARTIDRNVTVKAGAGTGKTTTLTERYLTILRAHLDGPESLTAGDEEPAYRVPDDIDRITDPAAARRLLNGSSSRRSRTAPPKT